MFSNRLTRENVSRLLLLCVFRAKHGKCLFGTYVRLEGDDACPSGVVAAVLENSAYLKIRHEIKF